MVPLSATFGIPGWLSPRAVAVALLILTLASVAGSRAEAQTYSVIHDFTGAQDGALPLTGLTLDRAGNLYGTTAKGGYQGSGCTNGGCGVVFKMTRSGSAWLFSPLYAFKGQVTVWDGEYPNGRVTIGPDGALYGTTQYGGHNGQGCGAPGCGTVFKLTPSPSFCRSVSCSWNETQLHSFTGAPDGANPEGEIAFDSAGNLCGATNGGGANVHWGAVYQLTPGHGSWQESLLYSFTQRLDGGTPVGGVTLGTSGDIYGTTQNGGTNDDGTAFQLAKSGDSWNLNTLYNFSLSPGPQSVYGVVLDSAGNLYAGGIMQGGALVVFELSLPDWTYGALYTIPQSPGNGIRAQLMMDNAGNLYGTTLGSGSGSYGSVFKLTPSGNGWIYTDLHDFAFGDGGSVPYSNVVMDAQGNLYGTASEGGRYGYGVVWKIAP